MPPTNPSSEPRTEEHRPPRAEPGARTTPALLVAFPSPVGLPIPPLGEAVGRAWLAKHSIADSEVSGAHLAFSRSGPRLLVEDRGSRNGVWLDGERLDRTEQVPLEDGAVLRIGRTVMVFRAAVTSLEPAKPLGQLVGPWGLGAVRKVIGSLKARQARNVLIEGPTGTGKELIAGVVRVALRGKDAPYTPINVAGVSSGVFEAQLFGWKKGAYSGSAEGGLGVIGASDKGSVFLDEIGELPLDLQPKLLRLLENREILPVGASRPMNVDVSIIGATNRPLAAMVKEGRFRLDLLNRFDANIEAPALRDRAEDIHAIACARVETRKAKLDPAQIEVEAIERLMLHDWPSNIRELDALLSRREAPSALTHADVRAVLGDASSGARQPPTAAVIDRVLDEEGQNQSAAARRLGISRPALRRLMAKRTQKRP